MLVPTMSIAAPSPVTAQLMDQRPTADAAALARDPAPFMPLPIPSPYTQKGAVAEAQLTDTIRAVAAADRVLKPYGVTMLPRGQAGAAAKTDSGKTQDAADLAKSDIGADADDVSVAVLSPAGRSDPAAAVGLDPQTSPVPASG